EAVPDETLWVESEAPEARPVFPPSSLFSLLANVVQKKVLTFLGEQITNISDDCVTSEHRGNSFGEQKQQRVKAS
ncbi:hypothetical protein KUCAC02_010474, partial [Chaenocephalus aceratus]